MKNKHSIGFGFALEGIKYAFSNHPNFYIHSVLGGGACLAGLILPITSWERILLFVLLTMGLAFEMVNTAIESVVDLVTEEWRENAKRAKDVASGAMLIYATGSAIVALYILLPPLSMYFT
jgi:diacylglycerol kinase